MLPPLELWESVFLVSFRLSPVTLNYGQSQLWAIVLSDSVLWSVRP